jgi:hypothetical protein
VLIDLSLYSFHHFANAGYAMPRQIQSSTLIFWIAFLAVGLFMWFINRPFPESRSCLMIIAGMAVLTLFRIGSSRAIFWCMIVSGVVYTGIATAMSHFELVPEVDRDFYLIAYSTLVATSGALTGWIASVLVAARDAYRNGMRLPKVRLTFNMRTLFVAVTLFAIAFQILAFCTRDYRKRMRIAAELRSMGAALVDFDEDGNLDWAMFVSPLNSPEIAKYKRIRSVDLSSASELGATIQYLSGLEEIQTLFLNRSNVTDEHLHPLSNIGSLMMLFLRETAITDKSIPTIASIPGLKCVDLSQTLISEMGIEELKNRRPELVVRY